MTPVSDNIVPMFDQGAAQPIFPFTAVKSGEPYDAQSSHILRFCVYVETDYDTDGEGRPDRVKVFVQVPRSAALGFYKAGTLFEACPYIAGINTDVFRHMKEVEETDPPAPDFSHIRDVVPCVPTGTLTSIEAAAASERSEWDYPDPGFEGGHCYDLDSYQYYLVRGFAVLQAGGFGTLGSDGVVHCGSHYERDAFCAVIEWVRGERNAYTDRTGTTAVRADWSNGNIAMTGKSYAGTLPFAVAVTGIPGLKTIIPVAGIADWYSHLNQQGAQRYYPREMLMSMLAYFCSSRYHDPGLTKKQKAIMDGFLNRFSREQTVSGFDYGPFWEESNYVRQADGLSCSALIVHGLNDDNVTTRQFEMMFRCFKKAGQQVKLLLHQGGHITPTMANRSYGIKVDGGFYDDLLNRWITHYLYDVENDAEQMPEVLVQSNLNQDLWERADSWETSHLTELCCADTGETVLDTDWEKSSLDRENFDERMSLFSSGMNRRFLSPVLKEDMVIQGTVRISFEAALRDGDAAARFHAQSAGDADRKTEALWRLSGREDDVKLTLLIADLSEEETQHIAAVNSGRDEVPVILEEEKGIPQGGGLKNLDLYRFETLPRRYRGISRSCMDLCNPGAGDEPESASASIELVKGVYHTYTVFMNPTRYTLPAGHRIAVIIGTEDPVNCLLHKTYSVSVRNASLKADVPVVNEQPQGKAQLSIFPDPME